MNRPAPWGAIVTSVAERTPFSVGNANVDPVSRDATWAGGSERLQPQTLKVLIALAGRRGEVVTRDELIQLCWDGRIVGDDVINRSISLLRQFAERAGGFEIETVPRSGYRLVEAPSRRAARWRVWALALSAAGLLVCAIIGWELRSPVKPSAPPAPTIALVPFAADSSDAQAGKLAAATHDAIVHTLSQGPFVVRAIDSAPQAGSPAADFLMVGKVTETPDKIVTSVRVEDASHRLILFSHQFEAPRGNASSFPQQVGAQVASQLSWTAPLLAIERRHPSDPAVTRAFFEQSSTGLQGNGDLADFENARRLALTAPDSPLAQIDLAYATAFAFDQLPPDQRQEAVALGRRASDQAIALAPESGEPYAPWCILHSEQRRAECEARLRKAIHIDPDAPFAPWFLAKLILNPVGRNEEAAEVAGVSLAHDPYMPGKIGLMLRLLEATGNTGEADALYRQSASWWPNHPTIKGLRLTGMVQGGDFERLRRFSDQIGDPRKPDVVFLAAARKSIPQLRSACTAAADLDGAVCMLALARLGDLDSAFALADRLYPSRRAPTPAEEDQIWLGNPAPNDVSFLTSPAAAPLRKDARFLALAERVGLLDYWRSGRLPDFCTKAHEPICAQLVAPVRK